MSEKSFVLGEQEYAVPRFTLGEVQKLLPLFRAETTETVAGMAAMATIVHVAVNRTNSMTFEAFQQIDGVTFPQILRARNAVGRAIGYLAEENPAPGEAKGEASP